MTRDEHLDASVLRNKRTGGFRVIVNMPDWVALELLEELRRRNGSEGCHVVMCALVGLEGRLPPNVVNRRKQGRGGY